MLVVHPTSTCDVCLEGYTGGSENIPYSISCGHVFCISCLRSLRQHICPLCRSPFEASDVRRLHVDRNDQHYSGLARAPSPRRANGHRSELADNNALGLFDDVPRAIQLQDKIADLVLQSSFTNGVQERGVRELIQEVHSFLNSEPLERHSSLRAPFLLLYRYTEIQTRYQQLESAIFDLRTENSREKQANLDWERKYQDVQRSRSRDQETARNVEASLRERLRIEELEWQRKYDFVSEECSMLRDELDKLRFSSKLQRNPLPLPPRSTPSTQLYFLTVGDSLTSTDHSEDDELKRPAIGKDAGFSLEKDDMFSLFNPELFHISPVPGSISLRDSKLVNDSDDEAATEKRKQKASPPHSRTSSMSSNISRASDSAAALKLSPRVIPVSAMPNRQRSESNPYRTYPSRSPKEKEPEVSTSAPSSYMYRESRALFPATPRIPQAATAPSSDSSRPKTSPEVMRLYSLLEKPAPMADPRHETRSDFMNESHSSGHVEPSRPILLHSSSFQLSPSHTSSSSTAPSASASSAMSALPTFSLTSPAHFRSYATRQTQPQSSLLSASQPRLTVQTQSQSQSQTQAQPQSQGQSPTSALSPVQKTPPRPVLPYMHSFAPYSPATPVSPQEDRVGARGTLPRRGSLSSASAAAAAQVGPRERESTTGAAAPGAHARRGVLATALATSASVVASAGGGTPALVPPSSLGLGKPHARGLWEGQDSD